MTKSWLVVFLMGMWILPAWSDNEEIASEYKTAIVDAYNQASSQFPEGTKPQVIKSTLANAMRAAQNAIKKIERKASDDAKAALKAKRADKKTARKAAIQAKKDAMRAKMEDGDTSDVDDGNEADTEEEQASP